MAKRQDIDTLKAWVHWVSLNPVSEDQAELARAVNDVISQVGTWKTKYEQATSKARNDSRVELKQFGETITFSQSQNADKPCLCNYLAHDPAKCDGKPAKLTQDIPTEGDKK